MSTALDLRKRKSRTKSMIDFPQGLIGFSSAKKFLFLDDPASSRFFWLASVDRPDLSFLLVDPEEIVDNYEPQADRKDLELLGLSSAADPDIYVIVTLPRSAAEATVNLRSPILINRKTSRGMQIVLEQGRYPTQHSFLREGASARAVSKV